MQLRNFFIAGLLCLAGFTSCNKKDDDIKKEIPIEGTWVGKYSILSQPYNNFYSFRLKAGGVLEFLDSNGQKTGEGSWEFYHDNKAIMGTYTLLPPASGTFSFLANFDNLAGKLDGTWGNGQSEYDGGYWFMNKIN